MLIRTYGERWRRSDVRWGRGSEILGWSRNRSRKANFWQMRGVYALYSDNRLIYVGQVFSQGLGARLLQHTKDELRDRWDAFSWYGTRNVAKGRDADGYHKLGAMRTHGSGKTSDVIDVLETLAIRMIDPPMNRQRAGFLQSGKRAEHFHQLDPEERHIDLTHQHLDQIKKELHRQARQLRRIWNRVGRIK